MSLRLYIHRVKDIFASKTSKDVLTVYFGKILEAILGLVSSIIVARELGPDKLGILMSLVAFANILGCLMGYGLDVTVVKFISDYRNKSLSAVSNVFDISISIRIIFIFISSLIVYMGHNIIQGDFIKLTSKSLFLLTILLAASNSLFSFCQSTVRGFERFVDNVVSNSVGRLLRLIFIIYYIYIGSLSAEIVLYANIISALVVVLIDLILLKKHVNSLSDTSFYKSYIVNDIFKYSFWMYIAAILGTLFGNMNIMMLNYYSAAMTVGLYAMAENLLRPFEFLPETLNQVFLPKVSAIETKKDFIRFMKKIGILGGLMAVIMSPLFLFPQTVISFFYGNKYTDGVLVLRLLALYLAINIFLNPIYIFAHRLNMPRLFTLSGVVALIVGFIANIQFIPKYGEVGCALTLLTVCFFSKAMILPKIYFKAQKVLP